MYINIIKFIYEKYYIKGEKLKNCYKGLFFLFFLIWCLINWLEEYE